MSGNSVFSSVGSYVPRTLQEDLERRGRLPARECVSLATALASALKHLHEHALVHRDVKPSNVIFVHGVPKLADIGLVATVGDSRSIVGTEGYLPPEGPGSPQADLYALGKLLYEVSTGMKCSDYPRLPPNLSELPDASELLEFNEVLLRACAKDTDRRYHRANELLADLALLERGESVKRLRRLERYHAVIKRIGIGALAVGLLISAAWWQSWRAQKIDRRHLAQLHLSEGTQRMVQGDYAAALPWLVGALELDAGDPLREPVHRIRLASVLERCPLPVAHFYTSESRVLTADLNRKGTIVATGHEDGGVRLWDARSGERLRQLKHDFPVALCQFLPSGDRLLTVTLGQKAHLWDLASPDSAPMIFDQKMDFGSEYYAVVLNEQWGGVRLVKNRHRSIPAHPFAEPFENLTLGLRLIGEGDCLQVHYEVRRTSPGEAVLCAGDFRDSPEADLLDGGRDDWPAPVWGRVLLMLENGSSAVPGEPKEGGRVVWDNLRARRYLSKQPPSPWRVVDDFSGGVLTNWVHPAPLAEGRTCRLENGQLVLNCQTLPTVQTIRGVLSLEPFEISREQVLEVEVDLVSARAPHPMVTLSLCRPILTPLTAPDRPFILHDRWLVLTRWDGIIQVWDLENGRFVGDREAPGGDTPLKLQARRLARDLDLGPDGRHLAHVDGGKRCMVWDLANGREVTPDELARKQVTGVRFSPDGRFLAVGHGDGLELVRLGDWQSVRILGTEEPFGQPRFSPRGNRLAAVRDGCEVVVWNLDDLAEPPATFLHRLQVHRIAFSPDGRYLASSSADGMVRVWDVVRQEPFSPPLPGALAQFNADGTRLLVLSDKGGVWLWDLSRIADDTMTVPSLLVEQTSATSTNRGMTAQIENQGIALKTPSGRCSLVPPVEVALCRVAFSLDDRYLIAESTDLRGWIWDLDTRTLIGRPRPIRCDAALAAHSSPQLPMENRDRRTLSDLAALLGGQRPDGAGGMTPVDEAERARLIGGLQRVLPKEFNTDDAPRLRWHQEQASAAEQAMDWDAAVFHWERALEGISEIRNPACEVSREDRLAYARQTAEVARRAMLEGRSRWSVVLPRPPWALPAMLDLSDYYTSSLGEPLVMGEPGVSFRELASGVRVLRGTGFDVRGIMQLNHTNPVAIPVGRACQRLHFLHASSPAVIGVREPAGHYRVVYASGEKAAVTLLRPDDVLPLSPGRFLEPSLSEWPGSSPGLCCAIVWLGYDPGSARSKQAMFLTRTTWELPADRRAEIVETIELQAASAESVPLLFAITAE